MTWEVAFLLLIGLLLGLLFLGQWIAVALGMAGVIGLFLAGGLRHFPALGSLSWNTTNNFVFTAVPLFILMGEVMLRADLSGRFYRAVAIWLRAVPGGLLHSNVLACAIFSAVSGSSAATAAAIGTVAIPELTKRGYRRDMVFGSLAAGGALGNLIPPGIIQIIYGALVGESVGALFIACLVPGLVAVVLFMTYIGIRVALQPSLAPIQTGAEERVTVRDLAVSLLDILPVAALLIVVLGGIYLGWTTPTEAAALGAAGAFVIAAIYRRLDWPRVRSALRETVRTTCMVIFVILGAQIFTFAVVTLGINRGVTNWVVSLGLTPEMFVLMLVLLYLILGCLMDGVSMVLLTLPVLYPVVQQIGFDPIWFGVFLTIMVELGAITPPVGINLFVIQGIANRPLSEVVRGSWPFVVLFLALTVLLYIFPEMAIWLPAQVKTR